MPPEETEIESQDVGTETELPEAPVSPPASAPVQRAGSTSQILNIPASSMARIKREERERGRVAYLAELDRRAKEAGFASHDELVEMATAARARNAAPKTTAPKPAAKPTSRAVSDEPAFAAMQEEMARLQEERRRLNRQTAHEEKRRRQLEQQLAAQEVEHSLRMTATRHGVSDVDYALELLRRKIQNVPEEELASFDETEFFTKELRKTHPYLFATESEYATTGVDGGDPGPGNSAEQRPAAPANGGPVNARKMSRDEYNELLAARGLLDPAASSTISF